MDLISVIVPVHKVEKYLDKCVASIVSQTYRELEIILVDDGSPDNCGAMCDDWAAKDSRVRVVHKQNGGLSDARNAGFEKATGDFVAFIDSDDWIAPTMLETLYQALVRDESDIAVCGVKMVWEDDAKEQNLTGTLKGVLTREQAQLALLEEFICQPVWYKLYRRKTVEGIPFKVGKYHEDAFWSYQVFGRAQKVSVTPEELYFYLQRENSIMGAAYSVKRLDVIEAMCERQDYMQKEFPMLETKAALSLWMQLLYHGQKVLKDLQGEEQERAMTYLQLVKERYPLPKNALDIVPLKQKLWLLSEKRSLVRTCKIRNFLKIGQ